MVFVDSYQSERSGDRVLIFKVLRVELSPEIRNLRTIICLSKFGKTYSGHQAH